jgi:hypothetical protein
MCWQTLAPHDAEFRMAFIGGRSNERDKDRIEIPQRSSLQRCAMLWEAMAAPRAIE